jgi:hypothetical protein
MGVDPLGHFFDASSTAFTRTPFLMQAWIQPPPPLPACAVTPAAITVDRSIARLAIVATVRVVLRIR